MFRGDFECCTNFNFPYKAIILIEQCSNHPWKGLTRWFVWLIHFVKFIVSFTKSSHVRHYRSGSNCPFIRPVQTRKVRVAAVEELRLIESPSNNAFINLSYARRITALDAAFPYYFPPISAAPLSPRDAEFVDAIHTSSFMWLGTPYRIANADFYPNNGNLQSGCPDLHALDVLNSWVSYQANLNPSLGTLNALFFYYLFTLLSADYCSHSQAYRYWSESLVWQKVFPARSCRSWNDFKSRRCDNNPINYMGYDAHPGVQGVFFIEIIANKIIYQDFNAPGYDYYLTSFIRRSGIGKLLGSQSG